MKKIFNVFFALFISTSLLGQAPQLINYQGVARDLSGTPIPNQTIGLRMAILSGSATGTEVYKEVHSVTTTALGLFHLKLGAGDVSTGVFSTIDWGSNSHFLQIEMDEEGNGNYELMGTSQLLSVPYALHAENGSKWNNSEFNSNFLQYDDHVVIGKDLQAGSSLLVNDAKESIGFSTNTAIAQFRRDYNGSAANFIIYGYPDTDLVRPHLRKSVMLYATEDADHLVLCAAKPQGAIRFFTKGWATPEFERMRIDPNGNVGIGTTNPEAYIHVSGSNARTLMDANGISSSVGHQFRAFSGASGQESEGEFRLYNTDKFVFNRGFVPNQTEVMAIDLPTGNVGIGALDPASKLQITDGDIYIEDINKGVIMKSPNGQCWRMTVSNNGEAVLDSVVCP